MEGNNSRERLENDHPLIFTNIENDSNLTKEQKHALYEHLDNDASEDILECLETYCYSKKLLGPVANLSAEEILGHVHSFNAFAEVLSEKLSISIDAALSFLDSLILDPELIEPIRPYINDAYYSKWLVWSFVSEDPDESPFQKIDLDNLMCRLGLPRNQSRYIRFGHRLPIGLTGKKPTFFDAGTNEYWRPGGLTEPLSDCSHLYTEGLQEIVHEPNTINLIVTAIEEL